MSNDMADCFPRVLITAGPTHEPIDGVRYIGNRSSGQMGLALASACLERGWPVTLLLGPVALPADISEHPQQRVIRFQTASDLHALLQVHWPNHDLLFMAAAVADFRPVTQSTTTQKINRSDQPLTIQLEPTPDLLAALSTITQPHQTVVGFALEPAEPPSRLIDSAQDKLARKHLDAIVANPLQTMDSPHIDGTLIFADGRRMTPGVIPKTRFAHWLLDAVQSICVQRLSHTVQPSRD